MNEIDVDRFLAVRQVALDNFQESTQEEREAYAVSPEHAAWETAMQACEDPDIDLVVTFDDLGDDAFHEAVQAALQIYKNNPAILAAFYQWENGETDGDFGWAGLALEAATEAYQKVRMRN